jgi:CheY-like chemotaxis protein
MTNRIAYREVDLTILNESIPGARILVVDDDEATRNLHESIFILQGYRVETTANGADALDRLTAGGFDLLVTDQNLPGLNGEQLVIALREEGIRIPVVVISGSLAECPLSARMAMEISAALPKPVRATEALAAILTAFNSVPPQLRSAA